MHHQKLIERFASQAEFAKEYSPLYHRLFSIVGDWLKNQPNNPVVQWLLEISEKRTPLEVTLLLFAGLHRDILLGESDTEQLANLYPSVSPNWTEKAEKWDAAAFSLETQATNLPNILHRTISRRQDALTPFIQNAPVQTNETGRGIVWILPSILTNWKQIHLVDLGASAGLNLVADQRAFRILNEANKKSADLGKARPVQFTVSSKNKCKLHLSKHEMPQILSRTGCDIQPFILKNYVDEATLTSYVWADQLVRIERLKEGIRAFKELEKSKSAPVTLYKAAIPEDLPNFFTKIPGHNSDAPVVFYNTFMTAYLENKGTMMRQAISQWAQAENRPVLWVQAEPLWEEKDEPPESGWLAWTVDLWQGEEHHQWQLGWIQPHGTAVHWLPEQYQKFVAFFKENS